jgi:hypothetical protein
MELQRQFAVRTLEFLFGASARNAQQFVVIAFCVRGQNRPFPEKTNSMNVPEGRKNLRG